ncbi:MAG: O-acetyl-ADP-ribose deacetylase [Desulfobacterales bacterium]|jgi:O-acetyl-ADP-ribose deacetylase (regulator of RNase III)|nr:O-acetyl-ADP-ribose deacetylase [Desulfobacterales bacterium]
MNNTIELVSTDITTLEVDCIVNAANNSLLGGGGVDGAIHSAAGPGLLEECRKLDGCATGEARITKGHSLPAQYVIHTVGPVWRGGATGEDDLLASCYQKSFKLVREYNLQSIAFPAISTGIYGFPKQRAAHIAIRETQRELAENKGLARVLFVCFNNETRIAYNKALLEKR